MVSGLYDKPVVIEGKRERKTPSFLASQTAPQSMTVPKPLVFEVSIMDFKIIAADISLLLFI